MSPHTDTSERGLDRLICTALTGGPCDPGVPASQGSGERPAVYGPGWIGGSPEDYDREYCADLAQFRVFLQATQPKVAETLRLDEDGPARRKFLARLQGEVSKRGIVDILRRGVKDGPHQVDLFYGTPSSGGGWKPELDRLSNILRSFNDQFGNIPWSDADRVHKMITEEIPTRVAADAAYQNAKRNSDRQNARIEHDKALGRVMTALLKDDTELFKQFMDNESFRRWLTETIFRMTYDAAA